MNDQDRRSSAAVFRSCWAASHPSNPITDQSLHSGTQHTAANLGTSLALLSAESPTSPRQARRCSCTAAAHCVRGLAADGEMSSTSANLGQARHMRRDIAPHLAPRPIKAPARCRFLTSTARSRPFETWLSSRVIVQEAARSSCHKDSHDRANMFGSGDAQMSPVPLSAAVAAAL
jgi:hypothetical protein